MIKEYVHKNVGTCSTQVQITYDDETQIIQDVKFTYGCPGNTKGVETLCKGRKLSEVRDLLAGIPCRNRGTSCPNELSKGIDEILKNI